MNANILKMVVYHNESSPNHQGFLKAFPIWLTGNGEAG